MIILLLILAMSMSKDSASDDNMLNTERPSVDSVRQLDYVHRMSNSQSHNVSKQNSEDTEHGRNVKAKQVNMGSDMSVKSIKILRTYIANKTVGLCDFTCQECYRCTLDYGKLTGDNEDDLFLNE